MYLGGEDESSFFPRTSSYLPPQQIYPSYLAQVSPVLCYQPNSTGASRCRTLGARYAPTPRHPVNDVQWCVVFKNIFPFLLGMSQLTKFSTFLMRSLIIHACTSVNCYQIKKRFIFSKLQLFSIYTCKNERYLFDHVQH